MKLALAVTLYDKPDVIILDEVGIFCSALLSVACCLLCVVCCIAALQSSVGQWSLPLRIGAHLSHYLPVAAWWTPAHTVYTRPFFYCCTNVITLSFRVGQ